MKKLFLTSSFWNMVDEFLKFLGVNPSGLVVGFVPTAADPYKDKWFVKADKKALTEAGFQVKEITIKDKTEQELREQFKGIDVIFVAGGNTFYLLRETRKSGFDKIVKELVGNGVVYVGSSAGAYLICPTIEAATWKPHDRDHFGVTDFTALNLVSFIMTVHFKPEYVEILKEAISNSKCPVRLLTDKQALAVEDEKVILVGEGEEVKL